tara:strand:- start:12160 stop:14169 length:2010 start_codon:yes stop_codon:yes gene_type:complete
MAQYRTQDAMDQLPATPAPTQPSADAGGLERAVYITDLQGNPIPDPRLAGGTVGQFERNQIESASVAANMATGAVPSGGPNDAVQRLPILTGPNQPEARGGIQQLPIKVDPNQPDTGGIERLPRMETGSTFDFDKPLPSGQTSTTVYELPGGMALPDAQNMSGEDFRQAVQQMNPGKGMMDMVRGLATEPGPAGNYARIVLRNAGAVGNAPLTPAQKQQIEEQMTGRMTGLLMDHALGQARGIAQGSRAIEKRRAAEIAEQKEKEQEEKDEREAILQEYQRNSGPGKEYENIPFDAAVDAIRKKRQEEKQFIEEGEVPGQGGDASMPPAPIYRDVDYLPADADKQGFSVVQSPGPMQGDPSAASGSRVTYTNPQAPQSEPIPARVIELPSGEAQALPMVTIEQAKSLPTDQSYLLVSDQFPSGRLVAKRGAKPEAPEEAPSLTAKDFENAEKSIIKQREDEFKTSAEGIELANKLTLARAEGGDMNPKYLEALSEYNTAVKQATGNVSNEDIQAEAQRVFDKQAGFRDMEKQTKLNNADPATVNELYTTPVRTNINDGQKYRQYGKTQVPTTNEGGIEFNNPTTPEQALALEFDEEGNPREQRPMYVKGKNAQTSVANYKTVQARQAEFMNNPSKNSLSSYLNAKFGFGEENKALKSAIAKQYLAKFFN